MTTRTAQRIEQYRTQLGLGQRAAAAKADLSQAMWCRIENGEKNPTLGQLSAIAISLGTTLESLTEDNPVRERLRFAARTKRPDLTETEQSALDAVKERLALIMEVNAHLRHIGVGVHHG